MALKVFKNKGEEGAIPINGENLNYNFNEIINILYPIGYILIKDNSEDYSNYLGFTWQRVFAGKTLVGFDSSDTDFDTIGKIGGEKEVTLTIDKIPEHQHGEYIEYAGGKQPYTLASGGGTSKNGYFLNAQTAAYSGPQVLTEKTGGGQSHNNLQPYYVIAYWKRIA